MRLEDSVERLVLDVLEPLGLEAMIEAAAAHVRAGEDEQRYFKEKIERARYDVDLTRRQYEAVDPANRLVARELERRWEKALQERESVEREAEARLEVLERALLPEDKERLRRSLHDLPRLCYSSTTRVKDNKRIIRRLIENVVVTSSEDRLEAKVHWIGGDVTPVEVKRGRSGLHRYVTDPEAVDLVREPAEEYSDAEIARILHCRSLKTSKGHSFTRTKVACPRLVYGIEKGTSLPKRGQDIYSAQQAAEILGVCHSTVIRWVEVGLLHGTPKTKGAS